jgi:phospholipase D1/2
VKFAEAQIALSRKWIDGDMLTTQKTVQIKIPQETTEGLVHSDKTKEVVQEFPIPESDEQAEETIRRFEEGAKAVRGDEDVSDNVCQHMLDDRTALADEKWLGTEEEELNSYVRFQGRWFS